MKKQYIIFFFIAIGLCLFGLVAFMGIYALYQQYSLEAGRTYCSAQLRDDVVLDTEEGPKKFQVFEIVCKRKDQFNATLRLEATFWDTPYERGNSPRYEVTGFPEQPSRRLSGIWIAHFYVLGAKDGTIGVFEKIPTQETFQEKPEMLKSFASLDEPQQDIIWNNDNSPHSPNNTFIYGFDRTSRKMHSVIILDIGGRSLDDATK
ncbi:MAG: hypothetical protein FWH27_07475 [Planctomycetaceae bacterium]|nr:hypothetical protein [Planctomycetaceae bacterium]